MTIATIWTPDRSRLGWGDTCHLSKEAIALIHYLKTRPTGWRVTVQDVVSKLRVGEERARLAIKALVNERHIEQGHLETFVAEGRVLGCWLYPRYGKGRERVAFCCDPSCRQAIRASERGYRVISTGTARPARTAVPQAATVVAQPAEIAVFETVVLGDDTSIGLRPSRDNETRGLTTPTTEEKPLPPAAHRQGVRPARSIAPGEAEGDGWLAHGASYGNGWYGIRDMLLAGVRSHRMIEDRGGRPRGSDVFPEAMQEAKESVAKGEIPSRLYGMVAAKARAIWNSGDSFGERDAFDASWPIYERWAGKGA